MCAKNHSVHNASLLACFFSADPRLSPRSGLACRLRPQLERRPAGIQGRRGRWQGIFAYVCVCVCLRAFAIVFCTRVKNIFAGHLDEILPLIHPAKRLQHRRRQAGTQRRQGGGRGIFFLIPACVCVCVCAIACNNDSSQVKMQVPDSLMRESSSAPRFLKADGAMDVDGQVMIIFCLCVFFPCCAGT